MKTVIDKIVSKIEKLRLKESGQVKFWISIDTYTDMLNEQDALNKKGGKSFWGDSITNTVDHNLPDAVLIESGVRFKIQTLRYNLQTGHFGDVLIGNRYCPIYVGKGIPDSSIFVERVKSVLDSLSKNPQDLHSI